MQPAYPILAMGAGLSSRLRKERRVVFLTAVDDTGSDPQANTFILAGFMGRLDQWKRFSDAWDAALKVSPGLDYFKSNEAYGMKGQFDPKKGWTEALRDARVTTLVRIIVSTLEARFSVSMRHIDFDAYMTGIPVEKRMKALQDPYFMLFYEYVILTASVVSFLKPVTQVEYVFDEQGHVGERARSWWPTFRGGLKNSGGFDLTPHVLEKKPSFDNDKTYLPLQAADLYAGQLSKGDISNVILIPPSPALTVIETMRGFYRPADKMYLSTMRAHFMKLAARVEKDNPEALKFLTGRKFTIRKR